MPVGDYTLTANELSFTSFSGAVTVADGQTLDLPPITLETDADHDGYGKNVDCDDQDFTVNPGQVETL